MSAAAKQTQASPFILELEGIRKVFKNDIFKRKETVIDQLNCRFPRGRCTGLLGHNGAGKTTTIRIIFGLIHADQGRVLFNGLPLTLKDKRRIGYMPETNKLPAALTSQELLRHHLRIFGYKPTDGTPQKALVEKALKEVGLWNHRHKRLGKLSKGMGRRLAWAMATIHHPELVILDEPTSGVDLIGRQLITKWIRQLKEKGTSIILCTHDLWSMQHLCDDVQVLRKGRLVYSTVDTFESSAAPSATLVRPAGQSLHVLKVSGLPQGGLEKTQSEARLPRWQHARQEGFLSSLYFANYPDATAWLSACAARGHVIVQFGEAPLLESEDLMSLFDGGE